MSTSRKTRGLWTMGKGEFDKSVASLGRAIVKQDGNPVPIFHSLRTDKGFADRIAVAMLLGGFSISTEVKLAQIALNQNIFGILEWTALYGVNFTKKQHRIAAKFPWDESVLNSPCPFVKGKLIRDTHFAFLGIESIDREPLTVAKWLTIHYPKTGFWSRFWSMNNPWHEGQPHINEVTLAFKWYLLLKDIVPSSTGKKPEEQMAMLPSKYEVPTTIAEVTKNILVFRKTKVRPNLSRWVACTERTIKTDNVTTGSVNQVSCAGFFDEDGLLVHFWNGDRHDLVGVGASRKI